jgi:hypothetical protein
MGAAGVFGGGNDVAAKRLGLAERKFANDVNHQAEVARAKAEDQRIARENLAIRQFMEPIRAQEAAANFARKMLDMKNELNGRHQLVSFNLALDELDPRDPDYETQVAQLRLSPQFSDIPHVKGADLAIEKYVAMTAKSRTVYEPLRKAGIDLEQFTVRGPRGEFMGFKLREAQKAVLTKALDDAQAIGGGRVGVGSQGVTIYPTTPEKPIDRAKEASEKARDKRWKDSHRLQINNNQLKEWHIEKEKLTNLKDVGDKQQHLAKIRHAEGEIKKLQDDSDRILKSHAQEDAPTPPPPTEQNKPPGAPPAAPAPATGAATGAAPITPAPPATGAGTAPASTTPTVPAKRIPFKDRMKEPASQPQASAAPDMDTLTASASDFSRFSGRREEIDSDPALSAEFNAASESMSQTLRLLGYDEEEIAASGGYVADGNTIEFEQDEDGEPVAVTVDPDGARTPLKKAASEAVVSIDSPRTAS